MATLPSPQGITKENGLDFSKLKILTWVGVKLTKDCNMYNLPKYTLKNPTGENSKLITKVQASDRVYICTYTYGQYWKFICNVQGSKYGWVKLKNETNGTVFGKTVSIKNNMKNVSKKDIEMFKYGIDDDYFSTPEYYESQKKRIPINLPVQNPEKDESLIHFLRSLGMVRTDSERKLRFTNFNRFQFADPYTALGTTREYLFFTKPDLHLVDNKTTLNPDIAHYPFYKELFKRRREIVDQLQVSASNDTNPFMSLLTNSVSNTLDLQGISSETIETGANIYGTAIQYNGLSTKSSENVDFSLEFKDGIDLEVYMLLKTWDDYKNLKHIGIIQNPPGSTTTWYNKAKNKNKGSIAPNPYRLYKILHDQIAIYKFVVADDNETIIYYACLYGAFPKSVPREAFSDLEGNGHITYSVEWHAQFVDDLNPLILRDFNVISYNHWKKRYKTSGVIPVWNSKKGEINGGWRHCPLIIEEYDNISNMYRPKLKWV